MSQKFVHLNVHTEFSLQDSLVRVKNLTKALKNKGMFAVGISDAGNMFSAIRIYQESMKNGIKPIIGCEVIIQDTSGVIGKMSLYAQNANGYKSMMELVSRSFDESTRTPSNVPIIPIDWLTDKCGDIIALTGAREGILGKILLAGNESGANEHLERLQSIFENRLYIELQRTGHPDDNLNVRRSVRLSKRYGVPVVATNGVRFIDQYDHEAHDIRVAIAKGQTLNEFREENPYAYSNEQYLKSPEQMAELFDDIPSAIENSYHIAKRCSVDITLGKNYLPSFPTENKSEAEYLAQQAREGLEERLVFLFGEEKSKDPEIRKEYIDRLEYEIGVINQMGFPGYFLIVADFIQWAKNNNVPVGPGRGSGAGSLVAYALKITDLDPLEYDLLFERFLNPERVSMPDFDIDFCMDGRERVIQYVADKYGHKAVSQIITYGTMAAKMVVRDVARALGFPYAVGNRLSQMIPNKPGTKLSDAIEEMPDLKMLYDTDEESRQILDISLTLEGLTRQVGKHAGGVVIAPEKLTNFTPTYCESDGSGLVSQYDKNDVEYAGLVKFDFLGLRTLTIIKAALDNINQIRGKKNEKEIDILAIPLDDRKTFELLQRAETTAVFQLESQGMKNLITSLKPENFEEIIALVALYRPGPMEAGMVDSFVLRKHGREKIENLHDDLEKILEGTYGVIVYQEQVMQTAQILAGYTLGQADMLRRAMGKKKPEEMDQQRGIFTAGALKRGIPIEQSTAIFNLMEKFAGYGFNKSHSAAYALIAYQTAWLKAHYPSQFMAAVLSSDMEKTEKVVGFMYEAAQMGIKVVPPHVNHSEREFTTNSQDEIVYGLKAIKGLRGIVDTIIKEREENGEYSSLLDFCIRCKVNTREMESLILSGALDGLGEHRASLMKSYPKALEIAKKVKEKNKNDMQDDLFGDVVSEILDPKNSGFSLEKATPWSNKTRLQGEKKTMGLYVTGHPLNEFSDEIKAVSDTKLSQLCESEIEDGTEESNNKFKDIAVKVVGQILSYEIKNTRKGPMAIFQLDDQSRRVQVIVPAKTYGECQSILSEDTIVAVEGKLTRDFKTGQYKILGFKIETMEMIRAKEVSHLEIKIDKKNANKELIDSFKNQIKGQEAGFCKIKVNLIDNGESREIPIDTHSIAINDDFMIKLKSIVGDDAVRLVYKKDSSNEVTQEVMYEEGNKTRSMRHEKIARIFDNARLAMG